MTTEEAGHVGLGKVVVLTAEYTGPQNEAREEKVNCGFVFLLVCFLFLFISCLMLKFGSEIVIQLPSVR